MSTRFDCEDEPNEFMDMPCMCDCGNWFDLNDGYSSQNSNKVVCKECKDAELSERKAEQGTDVWRGRKK